MHSVHTDIDYPYDRIGFATRAVAVGEFRCRPEVSGFAHAGRVRNFVVVFPRRAVWIEQESRRPFVADPSSAIIYNRGQPFERRPISAEGDHADWFAVSEAMAREVVRAFNPTAADSPQPFEFARLPITPEVYRGQRILFEHSLQRGSSALEVEERAIRLVEDVLRAGYRSRAMPRRAMHPATVELVEAAREVIMGSLFENLSVTDIAARVDCSQFHLCRSFRARTGQTLHGYRRDMRLRTSLGMLRKRRGALSSLALDLGFASQSHFTACFRAQFGQRPAAS